MSYVSEHLMKDEQSSMKLGCIGYYLLEQFFGYCSLC